MSQNCPGEASYRDLSRSINQGRLRTALARVSPYVAARGAGNSANMASTSASSDKAPASLALEEVAAPSVYESCPGVDGHWCAPLDVENRRPSPLARSPFSDPSSSESPSVHSPRVRHRLALASKVYSAATRKPPAGASAFARLHGHGLNHAGVWHIGVLHRALVEHEV